MVADRLAGRSRRAFLGTRTQRQAFRSSPLPQPKSAMKSPGPAHRNRPSVASRMLQRSGPLSAECSQHNSVENNRSDVGLVVQRFRLRAKAAARFDCNDRARHQTPSAAHSGLPANRKNRGAPQIEYFFSLGLDRLAISPLQDFDSFVWEISPPRGSRKVSRLLDIQTRRRFQPLQVNRRVLSDIEAEVCQLSNVVP